VRAVLDEEMRRDFDCVDLVIERTYRTLKDSLLFFPKKALM